MRFTQEQLTVMARDFLKDAYNLELKIPVVINGRLKSNFGRFIHQKVTPLRIEISKTFLIHHDEETIISTLKHECIHYALFVLKLPYNDGDQYFERELIKHGSHSTRTVRYKGKVQCYQCPSCKYIWKYRRRLARNGHGYNCTKCNVAIKYIGESVV